MFTSWVQWTALVLFAFSIAHIFFVKQFRQIAKRYPTGSIQENFFELFGEVEIIFGLWSAILMLLFVALEGTEPAMIYLKSRTFTEPVFVFAVLILCSTRPILDCAELLLIQFSKLLPFQSSIAFYLSTLILGPLLGSLITEPAAMTVTALVLLEYFYEQPISERLKYATIGVLFVNVSIGGTLTAYAAPPVLMVAKTWGWGSWEIFS